MPLVKAIVKEIVNHHGVVETDYQNQDLGNELNNMIINSIKGKLALLENMSS